MYDFDFLATETVDVYSLPPDHEGIIPNTTDQWYRSDSVDSYNSNLKDPIRRKLLEDNGWIEHRDDVFYEWNSKKLRYSEDFLYNDDVLFLGCSHTLGAGLPKHQTWTYLLSQKLQCNEINLGWSNQGSDYCFRMGLTYLLNNKPPKYVICLVPSRFRFEVIDSKRTFIPRRHMSNDIGVHKGHQSDGVFVGMDHSTICHYHSICHDYKGPFNMVYFYNIFMNDPSNSILNRIKNVLALEMLCKQLNIKCITLLSETTYETIAHTLYPNEMARDLLHFGIRPNKHFADKIFEFINYVYIEKKDVTEFNFC